MDRDRPIGDDVTVREMLAPCSRLGYANEPRWEMVTPPKPAKTIDRAVTTQAPRPVPFSG